MMLLTITATPAMEEELIDWLLIQPNITGFTSQITNGHGKGHVMNLAEQVTGRCRQITFMIQLENQLAESIINDLKKCFSGNNLRYWLVALAESGSI